MPFPNPDTQFKPGDGWRGNPGGRPRKAPITDLIRQALDRREIDGKPLPGGKTVAETLAEVMLAQAIGGRFSFAKEVLDRLEGKTTGPNGSGDVPTVVDVWAEAIRLAEQTPEDYDDERDAD
jgi:hypothetical protein